MESNILLFNGLTSTIYEKIKRHYKRPKYILLFSDELDLRDQFARICERFLTEVGDTTCSGVILLSCSERSEKCLLEKEWFCPWTYRIQLSKSLAQDTNKFSSLVELIDQGIKDFRESVVVNAIKRKSDKRYLLPVKNAKLSAFEESIENIFFGSAGFNGKSNRIIQRVKGRDEIRIGSLNFEYGINSGVHPVRKTTDTHLCDLKAKFRFGVPVNSRFEFDVSCQAGLGTKNFAHCDGRSEIIVGSPTHLNMRINDDFKY